MTAPATQPPADAVKVPGVGPVRRRTVLVAAAVVAGIVGYAYWARSRRPKTSSAAAYETTDGTPGMPIGYQNPAPTSPPSGPVEDDDSADTIGSNAEWGTAAINALIELGYNAQYVATIIGRYLAGQPLTPTEADVVRVAFARIGQPPINVPLIVQPTNSPNGPSGGGSTQQPPAGPSEPALPPGWYMSASTGAYWKGRNVPTSRITTSGTETWASIAARYGFAPWDLAQFNGMHDVTKLSDPIPPGTSVAIPHP